MSQQLSYIAYGKFGLHIQRIDDQELVFLLRELGEHPDLAEGPLDGGFSTRDGAEAELDAGVDEFLEIFLVGVVNEIRSMITGWYEVKPEKKS